MIKVKNDIFGRNDNVLRIFVHHFIVVIIIKLCLNMEHRSQVAYSTC